MSMFSEIEKLHKEMREVTLAAKVPEADYDSLISLSGVEIESDIKGIHDFLSHVKANEYKEVMDIWCLLPPDIWASYLMHHVTDLREQKLLKQTRRALRKVWRDYVHPPKIKKIENEQIEEPKEGILPGARRRF